MTIIKIVIAPDSFKGSLKAYDVAKSMEVGIKRVIPEAQTMLIPIADGGEGTMDSLVKATKGRKVKANVMDPLGSPVEAEYGWLGDGNTCVIELASASGIELIPRSKLNPMITTTFGTGELIKKALDAGCRDFIIALGGSATLDGGIGMLQALGMKLLDDSGGPVGFGGESLNKIRKIETEEFDKRILESNFLLASDVNNPLIGPNGAATIFGPQKNATYTMIKTLDKGLTHLANMIEQQTGIHLHNMPGAGAAGGIGGAFQAFFPVQVQRGIDVLINYTGLVKVLGDIDLVLTGEGQVDFQTISGKAPLGVAQEAKKFEVSTIIIAGSIGKGIEELYEHGDRKSVV